MVLIMKSVKFNAPQTAKKAKPQKDIIPVKYRLEEPRTREDITYAVPPGRVRRLIGRLAKTEIVPINDAKFILKLKESLDAEYDKQCDMRMKNREKTENARIRKLCIAGEMEPPEEIVEDLKNNPIYRINRTIAAVKEKISNRDKSGGFSKMPVRPLTPVEPFADEYKNYFVRRHLYGATKPSKSTMTVAGGRQGLPTPTVQVSTDGAVPIELSPKTSDESRGSNDKIKEKAGKGVTVKFRPSKSGPDMVSLTPRKSKSSRYEEVGVNAKTSFEKVLIEPIVKRSSKLEQLQQVEEDSSKKADKVEGESSEKAEEVEEEGAEKMLPETKPSLIHKPDELAPFKPFVSNLVSQVNEKAEPLIMFETGSDVLQTFTRQAKAAEQLLKNKSRADKNKPPSDLH